MIKQDLEQSIKKAFQSEYGWQPEELDITNPEPQFGDFALACHQFAKELKQSPQDIAQKLADSIKSDLITKSEAVAGYLNITIDNAKIADEVLSEIAKQDKKYGQSKSEKQKILLEYLSPNTNKPLHLGHCRNSFLGNAMAGLLESTGSKVTKVDIVNDRGIHIMKSLVAYQKLGKGETPESTGEKGDHFVGKYYVQFDEETMMEDAKEALRKLEAGDKEIIKLWKQMNKWVLDGFKETYKKLGAEFDKEYYESETYELGKEIVQDGLKKGVFYKEDDNSIWVDLEDVGLDKKIMQRADSTSVYVTQDFGLAISRDKEFDFDGMVYVVGHEQEYHFRVLFEILKKLGYEWSDNLHHLSYGLVYLPEGKMKSREGKVVDADDIIDEVKELAQEEIKKRDDKIKDTELKDRAEIIGMGALKFFLLRVTPTQSIHFNPKEAISFEGSTGPYVQYAHARISSILNEEIELSPKDIDFSVLDKPEEKAVIIKLLNYPDMVREAAANFNPSSVCNYLLELAHLFNSFYHEHHVLKADTEELKNARLLLIKSVQIVLRNGLEVLGIKAPDKM
ncbi:MAG: arginine--tRNA ligase [Patescibacteria group bacterium]|jgi:arginyl-tRNA synthetase|nr:arginine--tRNA ligase [Patescibacteria group bacterium]MDP6756441.1 arginine--tRNA ligase [Patescibacteria group bacterium]|tara:strand:+ start:6230 stop:7924 length:1695 start_codon:yes stop_codon:yes gene_type:complete